MAGQAASRDFAGLLHVLFSHPPLVRFPIANRLGFVFRLRSVNHALQIRPGMEAVFRYEVAADRRLPPVLDCAGDTLVAAGVCGASARKIFCHGHFRRPHLAPASDDYDANAAGDAACEKPPRRKPPAPPGKERRNK